MRYPSDHKSEVRERLVTAASHALRRDGLAGLSIPALMKKAGLTHGGFYVHFKNKDALVAAAVDAAADETAARVLDAPFPQLVQTYLSGQHMSTPSHGCVVAALGTEGRRQKAAVKKSFARAARGLIRLVERSLHAATDRRVPLNAAEHDDLSDEALETAARMVGAIALARLVDDDDLAARLLAVARAASLAGGASPAAASPDLN